tara:strand:- start:6 stop:407 length:402 start_codon:yes stop_codon:yes gene_type:complete
MQNINLFRRLASIFYDGVLVVAIVIITSLPFYSFNVEESFLLKLTMQLYFYLIIQYFFVWFWVNSTATLGMKSWKIKIVDINGNNISYKKAIVRFNASILSISIFGLGFLISLFRKDKKCLHDIISRTQLIKI